MSLSELVADLKGLVSQQPETTKPAPAAISVAHMFNSKPEPRPGTTKHVQHNSTVPYLIYAAVAVVVIGALIYTIVARKKGKQAATPQSPRTQLNPPPATSTPAQVQSQRQAGHGKVHFDRRVLQQEYEPEDAPIEVGSGSARLVDMEEGRAGRAGRADMAGSAPGDEDEHAPVIPIEGSDVWG